MMFPFLREKRIKGAVQTLMPGLLDSIQTLQPVERCATYVIAHGLLKVAEGRWGKEAYSRPAALSRDAVCACVGFLAESHAKVLEQMDAMPDRGMGDASYAQGMRQLRATAAVIALVGQRYAEPRDVRHVNEAWSILWQSRVHADQAADLLLRYRKFARTDAVPKVPGRPKGPITRDEIVGLATTLPTVFKRKPQGENRTALSSATRPAGVKAAARAPSTEPKSVVETARLAASRPPTAKSAAAQGKAASIKPTPTKGSVAANSKAPSASGPGKTIADKPSASKPSVGPERRKAPTRPEGKAGRERADR